MDGGGSNCIEEGLRNGQRKVSIRSSMKEKGSRFFHVCDSLDVVIFRLLG
jgi:hypothetical protein